MRIAVFVDRFLPVSETFILRQIVGLQARGHTVDIFAMAPAEPQDLNRDALRLGLTDRVRYLQGPRQLVRRVLGALWLIASVGWRSPIVFARTLNVFAHRRAALSLSLFYAAATLFRAGKGQYDIVHCQFGPLGLVALRLIAAGALSGRLVTSFRGYDATRYLKEHPDNYKRLFVEGDLFCPVSESLKKLIMTAGCSGEKTVVLASGVDCARLTYTPRRRGSDEPTRLLTVARLVEKKGVAYAVQAVARLVRQGRSVSYVIAGDGALRPDLERLIQDLKLTPHVRILGWVDQEEVARLLEEAHVLVAPSVTAGDGDQEGIPNVLKEAMAAGLPVVSTWHSGIPELVEDGVSGFLVAERDVDALADRLAYLIDHAELWPAMGWAGRTKVEREFDVERLHDRQVELYRQLLGKGTPIHAEDRGLAVAR